MAGGTYCALERFSFHARRLKKKDGKENTPANCPPPPSSVMILPVCVRVSRNGALFFSRSSPCPKRGGIYCRRNCAAESVELCFLSFWWCLLLLLLPLLILAMATKPETHLGAKGFHFWEGCDGCLPSTSRCWKMARARASQNVVPGDPAKCKRKNVHSAEEREKRKPGHNTLATKI